MKIKSGFAVREVGGKIVAVATGEALESFRGMIMLNGTGKFLWDNLSEETTEEELIKKLLEEYDVDEVSARNDVESFIEKLSDAGVIDGK